MSDDEDISAEVNGHLRDKRLDSSDSNDFDTLLQSPTRKTDQDKSGKFILRAATKEDPLHFIHRIVQSKDVQDEQLEEFVTLVRSNDTTNEQDILDNNTDNLRNLLTAVLIKQFENISKDPMEKETRVKSSETSDENELSVESEPFSSDNDSDEETNTDDLVEKLEIEEENVAMDTDESGINDNSASKKGPSKLELDLMAELQLKVKVSELEEEVAEDEMDAGNSDSDLNQSEEMTEEKFEEKSGLEDKKNNKDDRGEEMDAVGELQAVADKIDKKKFKELLIQMATHLHFGTGRNAYEIHIRPLKEKQDIEDIQISVQSLINSYEHPKYSPQDGATKSLTTPRSYGNEIQITIDRETQNHRNRPGKYTFSDSSKSKPNLLPDLIVSSRTKETSTSSTGVRETSETDLEVEYSKLIKAASENDPQFVLYKTLKDIFDGQDRDKQLNVKKSSTDHKLQRLKITKKSDRSVNSLFDVKESPKDMVGQSPSVYDVERKKLSSYLDRFTDKLGQEQTRKSNKVYWTFDPYNNAFNNSKDCGSYDVSNNIIAANSSDINVKGRKYCDLEGENDPRASKQNIESISCQEVLNIVLIESTTECSNNNSNGNGTVDRNKSEVMPWRRGARNNRQRPGLPWQFETSSNHNHFHNPPYVTANNKEISKPCIDEIITASDNKVIKFSADLSSETADDDDDEEAIFKPLEEILNKFGDSRTGFVGQKQDSWMEGVCDQQKKGQWLEEMDDSQAVLPYKQRHSLNSRKSAFKSLERWNSKGSVANTQSNNPIELDGNKSFNVMSPVDNRNFISSKPNCGPRKQSSILKSARNNSRVFDEIDKPQLKKVCKRVSFAEPEGQLLRTTSRESVESEIMDNTDVVTNVADKRIQKIEDIYGGNKHLRNSFRNVVKELGYSLGNQNEITCDLTYSNEEKSLSNENDSHNTYANEPFSYTNHSDNVVDTNKLGYEINHGRQLRKNRHHRNLFSIWMAKEKSEGSETSGDDYEYDFSAIEPTSSTLNVEASKQRALLRQKGSLAGRRKPTRASLRATANTEPQLIETVAANDRNQEKLSNGNAEEKETDSTADRQTYGEDIKPDTNTSQASLSQGPMLRTGKKIQGVKTAIVLPGIAELSANKSKLRSSKPPVPLPKERTTSTGDSGTEDSPSAPWLLEAKLRRQPKPPPKGEVEKLQQEAEPERPAWMKDAEIKRKRASNILTVRDQQKDQKDKENSEEQDRPVAPWMREAHLRKINKPGPITMVNKEILNTIDNNNILEHENPFIGQVSPRSDNNLKNGSISSDHKDVNESSGSSSSYSLKTPFVSKTKDAAPLESKTVVTTSSSSFSTSREDFLSPRSGKSNKEILQPIKKPDTTSVSSIHSLEQDENKPPQFSSTGSTAILRTKEVPPIKSNVLPPLKNPAKVPCSDLSNEDHVSTPSPTSSVVMREKPSTPIKPVMKRPITIAPVVDSPMKMFETPKWKKDLMDKKKKRETFTPVVSHEETNTVTSDNVIDSALPPWKRELEQRKSKRISVRSPVVKDESSTDKPEEVPDWIKQVQRRRSRYADVVSTKHGENGDP